MDLDEAILGRRSVRKYTDQQVTDDEIRALIEAARWAPSWANTQVWEFIVVRDRALIEQVTGAYVEKNPATKCSLNASALIVACARDGVSGCYDGKDVTKLSKWYMFDLGMAVQNLCLKAHAMGLGTVVVGFLDHQACRRILEVPEGYEVVAVLPVGRPLAPGRSGPPRKELSDFLHRDRFGKAF
ncbi:MAG TPA: nitroreductase family protein [Deltaproteobacteria bacterium]|jgi:nitroreductase|nr:nitroreductase family protein [Deltaproteobacteria bacterium]HOI08040.1 nitroreductase family protein [Deltaproteobacteria bacterium]